MKETLNEYLFKLRSSGFKHHSHDYIQKVESENYGDFDFQKLFNLANEIDGEVGIFSNDDITNIKNQIVGFAYIISTKLVEKGVDLEYAHGTADYFITQTNIATTMEECNSIFKEMLRAFEKLAKTLNNESGFSPLVRKCIYYISQNLYGKISPDDVASYAQKNASYLSTIFKKETGMPMHNYILLRKVDEAKIMLRTTNSPVNEIAESLGFSSQQHFSKIFSKYNNGISPLKYRKGKGEEK